MVKGNTQQAGFYVNYYRSAANYHTLKKQIPAEEVISFHAAEQNSGPAVM